MSAEDETGSGQEEFELDVEEQQVASSDLAADSDLVSEEIGRASCRERV